MRPVLRYDAYGGQIWRVIEGQYRPATLKIVDSVDEQDRLEAILEASKPAVPEGCRHLDYQLWSPFRYGRYPGRSRFRREGFTPGVFYGSEVPLTAALEAAWGRVAFYRASPDTPLPVNPVEHTAIEVSVRAPLAVDLMHPGNAGLGPWTDPSDYGPCCDLADEARQAGAEVIRYQSVRDPGRRANVAVLSCAAFAKADPQSSQTWHLFLRGARVTLVNESQRQTHEFAVAETAFEAV